MTSQSFRDLIVWQKSHELVLAIYKFSETFPKREMYSLTKQLRRSAVSIQANIVEGYRKRTPRDKSKFFNIAQGSLEETRYYLILANDLDYASTHAIQLKIDEVSKILFSYNRSVRNSIGRVSHNSKS